MPTRDHPPVGAPCWTDLLTSDVEVSRRFYCELFGWEALKPSPEFGGYFMFTRNSLPIAGGMGGMDVPAENVWTTYLCTDDIAKTLEAATANGAEITGPAMPIADLGSQALLTDPTGARIGVWQPETFPGFTVLGEQGAPGWFELHTLGYETSLDFYRSVFRWETNTVIDSDDMHYAVMLNPDGDGELAGIMDGSGFAPASKWGVYWHVDDADATVARAKKLGGAVTLAPEATPYGTLAVLTDPAGAEFKLRQPNP